jgi:hypothetical protein
MNLRLQTGRARLGAFAISLPRSSQRTVRSGRASRPEATSIRERNQPIPAPDGLVPSVNKVPLLDVRVRGLINLAKSRTLRCSGQRYLKVVRTRSLPC